MYSSFEGKNEYHQITAKICGWKYEKIQQLPQQTKKEACYDVMPHALPGIHSAHCSWKIAVSVYVPLTLS